MCLLLLRRSFSFDLLASRLIDDLEGRAATRLHASTTWPDLDGLPDPLFLPWQDLRGIPGPLRVAVASLRDGLDICEHLPCPWIFVDRDYGVHFVRPSLVRVLPHFEYLAV